MNKQSDSTQKDVGMSSRDFQANLGLEVTARQFRRYVTAGLIPKDWVKKNANGHFFFKVPKNARWGEMRERIEQWRGLRYARGWELRPRANGELNPMDKSRGIVTIQGLSQKFELWFRKMWPEIVEMDDESLIELSVLLSDASFLSWWIEEKLGISDLVENERKEALKATLQ